MKVFPCPICKGRGSWPGEYSDMGDDQVGSLMVQISPDEQCGYCQGEGMIEVNGAIHKDIKRFNLVRRLYDNFAIADKEYSKEHWEEITSKVKEIEKLF